MYAGQIIEIPIGHDGMTGTKNLSVATPNDLIDADSITYENGTVQKEGGATKYNTTPFPNGSTSILAGWDWWPDPITQRMVIYASDGKLYKDSGAGTFPTTLATGFSLTGIVPVFIECGKELAANNKKLVIMTGKDIPKYLSGDGVALTAFTNLPADWALAANSPSCGAVHQFRLWGGGNANDPNRIYYSTTGDHTDFTGAGSGTISVYAGEGRNIVGMVSFKGALIVFKYPRGIYFVDTTDPNVANWSV